jgi:bifunctional non-homologous end joining protein LigD
LFRCVVPAQPVKASKPPAATDRVHEIEHDGYPELIKATSFTIDGEAVVLGPDGLSRFDELSRRGTAQTAILHAFDLIEHDGEDLRNLPFLDRKAALARLLRETEAGILLNEHIAEDGPTVFAHACRLGAEGIVSKRVDGTYRSGPCPVWIKVRNPASVAVQRERSEIWNRRFSGSARWR